MSDTPPIRLCIALHASTLNSIHEKAVFRFYCAACCQARARSQCSVHLKACLLMLGVFSFFFYLFFESACPCWRRDCGRRCRWWGLMLQVLMTIEKAISRAPEATWVLVNPLLEDTIDSYTFGLPP